MSAPEQALAQRVADWLAADGWDVYPEVQLSRGGDRADLVAIRRPVGVAWAIACKMSFGFAVLEQAWRWNIYANWVSVAIPAIRRKRYKTFGSVIGAVAARCLLAEGIGVLRVGDDVKVDFPARFARSRYTSTLVAACGDQCRAMGVAGSKHQYYTPFRATREAAEQFVAEHPRCTIKEMLAGIEHHWHTEATARTCVAKHIARGVLGRIAVEPGSNPFRLIIKEDAT